MKEKDSFLIDIDLRDYILRRCHKTGEKTFCFLPDRKTFFGRNEASEAIGSSACVSRSYERSFSRTSLSLDEVTDVSDCTRSLSMLRGYASWDGVIESGRKWPVSSGL